MAQHQKADQDVSRIVHWLAEHYAEFEQGVVEEALLADSVGLPEDKVTRAVDYLENREAVVRFPHPSSTPPCMMIKPGRGWQEVAKKEDGQAVNH